MAAALTPLARIRALRDLSIAAVARGAGVAFETVKALEDGQRIQIQPLGKIARFLEVDPEDLLVKVEEAS